MITDINNWTFNGTTAKCASKATLYMGKVEIEVMFTGRNFEVTVDQESRSESYGDYTNVEIPVEVFDRVRGGG